MCSSAFSSVGGPICKTVSRGLVLRAVSAASAACAASFGVDFEASSSVARLDGSRTAASMSPSRLLSASSLGSEAVLSGSFFGGAFICFFSSFLLGVFTSCSIAPARDLSFRGFSGICVPGGGG